MELAAKPPAVVTTATRSYSRQVDEDAARRPCCFYGWVVWLVLAIGSIGTFFGTSSAITFVLDDIMAELDLTRSAISAVYMAGTLLGAAVQIPIGRAVDRYGGRRSIAVCSAAFAASCSCMSLPRHWSTLLLAFGFLRALGFGGLALATNTCLQQWFVRRRGLATGMLEATSSIVGYGLCSLLLHSLVEAYGWRGAYLRSGFALFAYAPVAALLLRSRPEDVGLRPDGDAPVADGTRQTAGAAAAAAVEGWRLDEALRTAAFWIIVLSNALQCRMLTAASWQQQNWQQQNWQRQSRATHGSRRPPACARQSSGAPEPIYGRLGRVVPLWSLSEASPGTHRLICCV